LAQNGTRIEVSHLFSSCSDDHAGEFELGTNGSLDVSRTESAKALCEAVFNGVMTLDEVEGLLIETAVDRARGNLSSAARSLGLTRAQLAYRLKRLN
jgi:DNA-binding NtrC family response regulator